MRKLIKKFHQNEEGSVVEYIILLAVVAVIMTVLFPGIRPAILHFMNDVQSGMNNPNPSNSIDLSKMLPYLIGLGIAAFVIGGLIAFLSTRKNEESSDEHVEERVNKMIEKEETFSLADFSESNEAPKTENKPLKDLIFEIENMVKSEHLANILEKEAIQHTYLICDYLKLFLPRMKELNIETQHDIERIASKELLTLFHSFLELNKENQTSQKEVVTRCLHAMEEKLDSIFIRLEEQKLFSFMKTAKTIAKRYEKTS